MTDIGTLGGSTSWAWSVSGNGSITVGESKITGDTETHAFKYVGTTMTDLGTLGGTWSTARGISSDGTVIVGNSKLSTGDTRAFKYVGTTMTDLGTLGGTASGAYAASSDGSVIVGYGETAASAIHAFKYSGGTMTDLGVLAGGNSSQAYGVSGDGSVIVGQSGVTGGYTHAFKYTGTTMTDLGSLGGSLCYANAVSYDGTVIVGYGGLAGDTVTHAFKYVGTTMTDIGTLGGNLSNANAVSSDGSVIVGHSTLANGDTHAFKYSGTTMTDLGALTGSNYAEAWGVSSDGSIIVGFSRVLGQNHAFVYRNSMVDVNNTYDAIGDNGRQLSSIVNLKTALIVSDLDSDCSSFGAHNMCVSVGGSRYTGTEDNTAAQTAAKFVAAYRIADAFRAGVVLDWGFNATNPSNFHDSKNPLYGAFVAYGVEDGAYIRLSAMANKTNATITRTVLNDTEAGQGNTDIRSYGLQAEAGYGIEIGKYNVKPYLALRRTNVTRLGYVESAGASMPVAYNDVASDQSTYALGARAGGMLAENFGVDVGAGFEHDLDTRNSGYTGTIDTLGSFDLSAPAMNKTRPFGSLGMFYKLSASQRLSAGLDVRKQTYENALGKLFSVTYAFAF
ncbi:MAG: hypothetical protein GX410_06270 [Elusimicrobia bacterium]|nr:hypothetical protein [Elusimicrobiota bacterium]